MYFRYVVGSAPDCRACTILVEHLSSVIPVTDLFSGYLSGAAVENVNHDIVSRKVCVGQMVRAYTQNQNTHALFTQISDTCNDLSNERGLGGSSDGGNSRGVRGT